MPARPSELPWYDIANAVFAVPDDVLRRQLKALERVTGRRVTRQKLCHLKAISKMAPSIGHLCDDLGPPPPWSSYKLIAHARPAEQRLRARDELARVLALRERRDEPTRLGRDLLALLDSRHRGHRGE